MITFNPIFSSKSLNFKGMEKRDSHSVTNSINSTNINNLNHFNKSLISFKGSGFYQTLNENYFNLPIDKTTGKAFEPDIYQKSAAENLFLGNDVIVSAPTGTGKTAIAHYVITKNMKEGKKTFYTTPLKALSNDKIREFQKIYGEDNVGLITGDVKVNKDAPVVIMTTEVYRNMVLNDKFKEKNPMLDNLKTVVFDELHYLGDSDRGGVWEQAIMFTNPETQILSLSGTMANADKITDWMASVKEHEVSEKVVPTKEYKAKRIKPHTVLIEVPSKNRHVPLEFEIVSAKAHMSRGHGGGSKGDRARAKKISRAFANSDAATPSKESYLDMVDTLKKKDRLPAIFFIFSKREGKGVLNHFKDYGDKLTNDAETKEIQKTIKDFKNRGKCLGVSLDESALEKGYALHNAGMLPDQKELVEELFQKKLLKVVISTETLSAGINMPARSTVICALRKPTDTPDGTDHKRYLSSNEFHQMAGRAGRRGIDTTGYCYAMAVNNSQRAKFDELIKTPSNDINSHFKLDYSFVATANDVFENKKKLRPMFRKSLCAYDKDPCKCAHNAINMVEEFDKKENILKRYRYIDEQGGLTNKGVLLTQLNGYEQIPVIDMITSQKLGGLNAVQLAGVVSGLANLSAQPKTDFPDKQGDTYYEDDVVSSVMTSFSSKIKDYNSNIYSQDGNKELEFNADAVEHIYKWAELNNQSENSTENWETLYSGDLKKTIKDEGSLFREIMMTNDLLKQMKSIVQSGYDISEKESDKRYYSDLEETIQESIKLINRPPAKDDKMFAEI